MTILAHVFERHPVGQSTIKLGLVGIGRRGGGFRRYCELIPGLVIEAVCDTSPEQLKIAQKKLGARSTWTDFQEMIDKADIDAVIISTPMQFHGPQSTAALKRGLHVLCEVTPAVSLQECRDLVAAASQSEGIYMLAENYIFSKTIMTVTEMVRRGVMGTPYYAEGEYIHELKVLNELTPWRRRLQTGVNGITYGTHSLGPILQWMPGDRVTRVSCEGTGQRHKDPRGDAYENEASCVMLGKTRNDALIKIRVDMLSDRPHAMNIYHLQGTDGCFESGRGHGEDVVWLKSRSSEMKWTNLTELQEEFVSPEWKRFEEQARQTGHGGSDFIELVMFIETIRGQRANPIDIHHAMDMALPGLISQQSILQDGQWLAVPDSREWV